MKIINKLKGFLNEYKNIMQNKKVMKIILAGFISSFGSKITYFALLRKVAEITNGKITELGKLSIIESIPFILFGVFAGIVIDKFSRKKIMIISDLMSAAIVISFLFVTNINLIYLVSFFTSFVYVFRQPAQSSFEPNLVDKEDIALLNSFKASVNSLVQIVCSALGAAVVGFVGSRNAFIIDSITFLLSALIISTIFIKEKHLEEDKAKAKKSHLREFADGVSIIWKDSSLKLMVVIDVYVTFAMSMQGPLIYYFIRDSLKMGDKAEVAWGILLSSLGVGAILGSLVLGILVKKYENKFKLFLNVLMFDSLFFSLFLLNRYFPLSILIFAFLGCIGTASAIIFNTVIQNTVPDESRGKVFSALSMMLTPVSILSIYIGTTAADIISAKNVLLLVAIFEGVIALGVRLLPTYRKFDKSLKAEAQVSITGQSQVSINEI